MSQDSVITEEMRQAVGVDPEPATHLVEAGAVKRFAEAIGDPNPVFNDETAARDTRHGGLIASPLFLRSMGSGPDMLKFESPYPGLVDGGGEWEFFEPVRVGDSITTVARITDLKERSGSLGAMLIVAWEVSYANQLGAVAAKQRGTFIYYQPSDEDA